MARVLAVDDDTDILAIVEGALEFAGHDVLITTDPRQAVYLAYEHDADVVVLDVNMPEMSGFETLEALRADPRTRGLPVLFLSALGDSDHRIAGLRRGAEDYLVKPFEPEELVLRVERLAARRQASTVDGSSAAEIETAIAAGDFDSREIFLGRYQALEVLGKGAMGVVLRGWDPRLKRPVALKTLRLDQTGEDEKVSEPLQALFEEAATLARFHHPNIVAVHDVGSADAMSFIVMELVDGISLQRYLEDHRRLSIPQSAAVGTAVARALSAAHDAKLVHRDVKPGNTLLGLDGSIKVTDFGIAGLASALATGAHRIFGTPGYVPPEVLLGEAQTAAGDLFSLGVLLYRGLTGEPPFIGDNLQQLLAQTLTAEAIPLRERRAEVPPALESLVGQLLAKEPETRPSALEVDRRLAPLADDAVRWRFDPGRGAETEGSSGLTGGRLIDTLDLRRRPAGEPD